MRFSTRIQKAQWPGGPLTTGFIGVILVRMKNKKLLAAVVFGWVLGFGALATLVTQADAQQKKKPQQQQQQPTGCC